MRHVTYTRFPQAPHSAHTAAVAHAADSDGLAPLESADNGTSAGRPPQHNPMYGTRYCQGLPCTVMASAWIDAEALLASSYAAYNDVSEADGRMRLTGVESMGGSLGLSG